jgi:hypothetical protein
LRIFAATFEHAACLIVLQHFRKEYDEYALGLKQLVDHKLVRQREQLLDNPAIPEERRSVMQQKFGRMQTEVCSILLLCDLYMSFPIARTGKTS